MSSAERRLDEALRAFKRSMYGDEEFHREKVHEAVTDKLATYDEPPDEGVRQRLIPNWAWWKRRGK